MVQCHYALKTNNTQNGYFYSLFISRFVNIKAYKLVFALITLVLSSAFRSAQGYGSRGHGFESQLRFFSLVLFGGVAIQNFVLMQYTAKFYYIFPTLYSGLASASISLNAEADRKDGSFKVCLPKTFTEITVQLHCVVMPILNEDVR